MRLSNYFLAFFLFFLLGCNKEAIIKDQYLQSTNNENHEVSHEEVLKTMESVIQLLAYPRGITKSQNVRREIANIKKSHLVQLQQNPRINYKIVPYTL